MSDFPMFNFDLQDVFSSEVGPYDGYQSKEGSNLLSVSSPLLPWSGRFLQVSQASLFSHINSIPHCCCLITRVAILPWTNC
ncbi:hypothetical protein PAHAL_4G358700 [Panicum hallii]|uniref:Uncharacterized protein n=1 Tax=Panicum hallii TaxID=206008 RepID=A0A2T8JF69_9POAL|nr:hypothetical protein PAHAL_4G358700 [Panicum hallii]